MPPKTLTLPTKTKTSAPRVSALTLKIEKGIPIPRQDRGSKLTAVLQKMECGDSVFLPTQNNVTYARLIAKNFGISLKTRAEGEGFRVWRVAGKSFVTDNRSL